MNALTILGIIFNSLLLLLIILSYLPQYLLVKRRQSTHGLSPLFILFCSISSASNLANLLILPVAFYNIHERCRYSYSDVRCKLELMPHWQVGTHWVYSQVIFLQYLWYRNRNRCSTVTFLIISAIFHVFLLSPSLFLALNPPFYGPGYFIIMQIWSWVNICISAVLSLILFLPQIYCTFALERMESLSIPTMIMQAPAYFLLAASLVLRFKVDSTQSVFANYTDRAVVWVNYLVAGLGQSILLGLSMYFVYIMPMKGGLLVEASGNGGAGGTGDGHPPGEDNEREDADGRLNEETPLLSTEPSRVES